LNKIRKVLNILSSPEVLVALSQDIVLKGTEAITKSKASIYDKAMDYEYLRTHIGGGNHRMFDGGHTLAGAWDRVRGATSDDTVIDEVIGYSKAVWKDLTTTKGLPFVTWSKDSYDATAQWVVDNIPFATKEWFYDLNSYDVMEVFASTVSLCASLLALKRNDTEKLSEMLGVMGITSILSANVLLGIVTVVITAYSFAVKKNKIDVRELLKGIAVTTLSAGLFSVLGLPFLINVVVVIICTSYLRKSLDNTDVLAIIKELVNKSFKNDDSFIQNKLKKVVELKNKLKKD